MAEGARLRRAVPWILAAGLAGVVALGPIGPEDVEADVDGARRAVRELQRALQAGEMARLGRGYASDADHRDLRRGLRARGPAAIRAFFAQEYGPHARGVVEVASFRPLTDSVAIAQLTMLRPGDGWPPYIAALLHRGEEGWRVVATRAGGNPDTRERAVPAEPGGRR